MQFKNVMVPQHSQDMFLKSQGLDYRKHIVEISSELVELRQQWSILIATVLSRAHIVLYTYLHDVTV